MLSEKIKKPSLLTFSVGMQLEYGHDMGRKKTMNGSLDLQKL